MLQLQFVDLDKPPVWLVDASYIIGGAPHCDVMLSGRGILTEHAELAVVGENLSIKPTAQDAAVFVDHFRIREQVPVHHNTRLRIGEIELIIIDPKKQKIAQRDGSALAAESNWYLQGKTTALANKKFPLAGSMTLGRARECEISLAVAHLSRKHARLTVEGNTLWVEDLGSSNGTFLNGERVGRSILKNGDELSFDTLIFLVLGGPAAEPQDNQDKTSLRPALTTEILAKRPDNRPSSVARAPYPQPALFSKPAEIAKLAISAPNPNLDNLRQDTHAAWQLWLGIAVVILITTAALLYVLS